MAAPAPLSPPSNAGADFRVALVCLPWYTAGRPSIQIGLVGAIARQAGFPTDLYHLNLDLAARTGPAIYEALCNHRGHLTGDWLFSVAAFGEEAHSDDAAYFAAFGEEIREIGAAIDEPPAYLSRLRHDILPQFIDDCLAAVDWGRYRVVGFSSTFQQNVACLALARRIKGTYPDTVIVFGGANMEDEMGPGYARAFTFVDYVLSGEADESFPALLRCLAAGQEAPEIPGLALRTAGGVRSCGQAPPVRDLDELPVPDYREYFARRDAQGLQAAYPHPVLPFESSRGCWWGAKHHCSFCGLNDLIMPYRAKRPERVLAELTELAARHGSTFFAASDNILDMKHLQQVLPRIAEAHADFQFFYEVKANLTREQIGTLARGGVRWIQAGIESVNTNLLRLMNKGSSMLQNVLLLKWARYYGIHVSWNILWGFPGETEADYQEQLAVLQLIPHLEPPNHAGRIRLERFSPYFTGRAAGTPVEVRPDASYAYVYPGHVPPAQVAYFFEYAMDGTVPDESNAETVAWVAEWERRWFSERPDTLSYRKSLDRLFIDDHRGAAPGQTYTLTGPAAPLYEYCGEAPRTVPAIISHLDGTVSAETVSRLLRELSARGLMLQEGGRHLSLALPANPGW